MEVMAAAATAVAATLGRDRSVGVKFHGSVVCKLHRFGRSELLGRLAKVCGCPLSEGSNEMEKGKVEQTRGSGSK